MTDEEKDTIKNFNTNECLIYNLTEKVTNLEKENAELKEKHESNKRALKLIIKKGVELEKENAELKAELQHYADVINRLMGTQLTDTEEIGRLIAIAQYGNWSEL